MKFFFMLLALLLSACVQVEHQKTDADAIVQAVLVHPAVASYIHPEMPGRIPVRVALAPPAATPLNAYAFGKPVLATPQTDPQAIVLGITASTNEATVTMEYRQEGVSGLVKLHMINGNWVVTVHQLWEHRSNNSFKPSPLRGLGTTRPSLGGPA